MSIKLYSPQDLLKAVGARARQRRLLLGHRQEDLASTAGVPIITVRRFESGKSIGFEAVAKIALALHAERAIAELFPAPETRSIDDILKAQRRPRRARKRR
jgi:transcriptional regulator with XRE-family HTH domain